MLLGRTLSTESTVTSLQTFLVSLGYRFRSNAMDIGDEIRFAIKAGYTIRLPELELTIWN